MVIPIGPIMKIAGAILAILALFYMLNWASASMNCLAEQGLSQDCLNYLILQSPPVKPVIDIATACNQSEEACLGEIGKQAITKKVETTVRNYNQNNQDKN